MKKLITALLVMIMMVPSVTLNAASEADIFVEAEDYTSATFSAYADSSTTDMSGGKIIAMYKMKPNEGKEYSMTYTVEAPSDGAYILDMCCSILQKSWTTDFSISVNGEEPVHVRDVAELTADVKSPTIGNDLMKNYHLGGFYLEEGANTVKLMIDTSDLVGGGVSLWLDWLSFTKTDFAFARVASDNGLNIYEADENVKYDFMFNSKAADKYTCTYRITDYWGRVAEEKEFSIAKGERSLRIDLGKFELGWYRLEVIDKGKAKTYAKFSVVPEFEKRYKGETPFATDVCLQYYSKGAKDVERLMKAARLAGITSTRERGSWEHFGKTGNTDYQTALGHTPAHKKVGMNVVQHTESHWFKDGWDTYKDLLAAYNFQQNYAKTANGIIDVLEIDNEVDGGLAKATADDYAAYLKTLFISNADAGTNMKLGMTSLCMSTDNVFNEGIRLNGAMDYTDFFNIHAHTSAVLKERSMSIPMAKINNYMEMKMESTDYDMPVYMTEAGLYSVLENGSVDMNAAQAKYQANYLPRATAEALSCGVEKFFWFIWPKFIENNQEMGTFDSKDNPNPSYQSEAICSYILGKAKFKGLTDKENISGYLFDNGTNDVMMIWTQEQQNYDIITETPLTITDIMGGSYTVSPVDGKASIRISEYPVYVSFKDKADTANYYPREYNADTSLKREFTPGERIILNQSYSALASSDAHTKGYTLTEGVTEKMVLGVHNFNKTEKTITLKGELEGYNVKIKDTKVKVPAMSKVDVNVELEPQGEVETDTRVYLKFTAETDGFESSPSVATIRVASKAGITPKYKMEEAADIDNFDITNVVEYAEPSSEVMSDGSYRFGVRFGESVWQWYCPKIKLNDTKAAADSDGIVFWVNGDEVSDGQADIKVFLDYVDGRRYYSGQELLYPIKPGWVQVKLAWEDFALFSSPYGHAEIREFDPSLIEYIEIGAYGYSVPQGDPVNFYIKDPGYFENKQTASDVFIFENIEDGKKYSAAELSEVKVTLPAKTESVSVMITDEHTEKFTHDGQSITVDLSELSKGKHTLRVIIKDKYGFTDSDRVNFYID